MSQFSKDTKGVYCLTSPSGKRYVGIGMGKGGIYKRWNDYKRLNCKNQTKLYHALKKYGPENFKYEVVLETDDIDNAYRSEMYLIDIWNLQNDNYGYNISEGGKGNSGHKKSEECRINHSKKMTGRICSPEQKAKMSNSMKEFYKSSKSNKLRELISKLHTGKVMSEEARKRMSEIKKGKPLSEEHIEAMRIARTGMKYPNRKPNSREARINQSKGKAKHKYFFNGTEVDSLALFCDDNNLKRTTIIEALKRSGNQEILFKGYAIKRIEL
jgi:group I intron endonuclease